MYPFIETIRIEDGKICNLAYHQQRVENTFAHFWPEVTPVSLQEALTDYPKTTGILKARLLYQQEGVTEMSYSNYTMRQIKSLKLVENNELDYSFKSADRRILQELSSQRGEADELIIVRKGLLTDTSYSNIALFDGTRWFTPSHPLLNGTMRQSLLEKDILTPIDITVEQLSNYQKIALINAMMPLGRCEVSIKNIIR